VPGGSNNTAASNYSLAAGYMANTTAAATDSFVWTDATGSSLTSITANEFRVRAANGAKFIANNTGDGLLVDDSAASTNADGIHVEANVSLGSNLGAVYALNVGTSPGNVAKSGGTYAGIFNKQISVSGGCTGGTLVYVARNEGMVQGLAYVKADAGIGMIVTGWRLTASGDAGQARALQTRTFEGMAIMESAPIIGIALAPLDKGQGLIPVMVTLR
jgi:hypothetical protein